jgi:hypothetical protein
MERGAVTGPQSSEPPKATEVQHAAAAYGALMNAIVPESQYNRGARENPDKIAYLGNIIERAAARRRERSRQVDT